MCGKVPAVSGPVAARGPLLKPRGKRSLLEPRGKRSLAPWQIPALLLSRLHEGVDDAPRELSSSPCPHVSQAGSSSTGLRASAMAVRARGGSTGRKGALKFWFFFRHCFPSINRVGRTFSSPHRCVLLRSPPRLRAHHPRHVLGITSQPILLAVARRAGHVWTREAIARTALECRAPLPRSSLAPCSGAAAAASRARAPCHSFSVRHRV